MAPERGTSRAARAVEGIAVAAFAVAVGHLAAAFVAPGSSPAIAVGQAAITLTPEWLKDFAIQTFGSADKLALGIGMAVVIALIAAWVGIVSVGREWIAKAALVGLALIGAIAAATRPEGEPTWILPSAVAGVAGLIAFAWLQGRDEGAAARPVPADATPAARGPHAFDRRTFVRGVAAVGGAAAVAAVVGSVLRDRRFGAVTSREQVSIPSPAETMGPVPPGADLGVEGLTPYLPPTEDFYRVDTALFPPQVRSETWRLRIHGMVDRPLTLTYDQLLARELVERDITLSCVSNEVGGPYVGNARWTGVLLAPLLEEAGIRAGADQLVSRSADGMTIGTPTAAVMDGRDAMLAVAMNGEPLPIDHGFPVRMVVPGLYGYVSATKWVVEIEASTFGAYDAYWIERGWAEQPPPIETASRIDTPRGDVAAGTVAVAGVAWAPNRGIERVEVRVDGGDWHDAELADVPSVDTWRQWLYRWEATSGMHTIEVRATDGDGITQTEERTPPFPNGSTGWHSVTVNVS